MNSSSQPVGCLLVHKDFDSAPDFDVRDGVVITKLAVHCVDLDERKRPTMTQIVNYLQRIPLFSGNFGDAILRGDLIDEWDIIYRKNCWEEKNSNAENKRMSFLPLFDHED